jgi:hypothetical protein
MGKQDNANETSIIDRYDVTNAKSKAGLPDFGALATRDEIIVIIRKAMFGFE